MNNSPTLIPFGTPHPEATSLSPEDFVQPTGVPLQQTDTSTITISDADEAMLRRTLNMLRAIRQGMASDDSEVRRSSEIRLKITISYLVGFFDSRGWIKPLQPASGFISLFGEGSAASLESVLADLETGIDALLVSHTRGVLRDIGDACVKIGTTLIAAAIVLALTPAP